MTAPSLHVLVVDDDRDIRETVVEILRDEGYTVSAAADGADALQLLDHGTRPDVILLDLMMPTMSGFEFRERQLADPAHAAIPVVIVSADGNVKAVAARLQVTHFLTKPVKIQPLLDMLQRVVDQALPAQ